MRLTSMIHQACWKRRPDRQRPDEPLRYQYLKHFRFVRFWRSGSGLLRGIKAALNHLTRFLANELTAYSVRANAVCPVRFPDSIPTARVVDAIIELMQGHATGQVIEVTRAGSSIIRDHQMARSINT